MDIRVESISSFSFFADILLGSDTNSISEDSFEALFQNLSAMKSKAGNLPSARRKDYAKEVTVAFWRAMGGDDSEIEGISSDEDETVQTKPQHKG